MEPCKHRYYKNGDSWVEEVGFTRRTFHTLFDQIGTRHKSKTQFFAAKDKFKGKFYASYYDRDTNQTFYIRNHKLAEEFIKSTKKPKTSKRTKFSRSANILPVPNNELPLRTDSDFNSSGGTIGGNINIPTFLTDNTTLERPISKKGDDAEAIAVEMKKIWVEELEDFGDARIPMSFSKQLFLAFKNLFNGCLERWRSYCRLIASSKFLMGEGNNRTFKKIWITWAIKSEIMQRIKNGEFGLNTRTPKISKQKEALLIEEEALRIEKIKIENSIEMIQQLVDQERRKAINDHIDGLSETQREALKSQFIESLEAQNDDLLRECGEKFWQTKWAHRRFEWFIRSHVTATLFPYSLEEEVKARLQQTNLPTFLQKIEMEINKLQIPILSLNPANC